MLWGVPPQVKTFFTGVVRRSSRPIRRALPAMVLAFLLAPHCRRLKTIAGMVLGHRRHGATISRRLVNPKWKTRDWYTTLYEQLLDETNRWERRQAKGRKRQWIVVIDTTHHTTMSEQMENLIVMSRRQNRSRRDTRQHAFVMGLLLTDKGGRLPLPRRSYYTRDYCRRHRRRYRSAAELAAGMLKALELPDDVEVTVVFDSAFDADVIHRVCRRRGFRAVFPIDPNRNLAVPEDALAEAVPGQKVVAWTRSWDRQEFELLELQVKNEDHVFFRRRHRDNLRSKKTHRRYAAAARHAAVSRLGPCLIVASYKENPKVELLAGQSADWWAYHTAEVPRRRHTKHRPARWHGKVLACTDVRASVRQVIEWYEVRWQVELFFRELKSRLQFEGYVLMKFEAVERYVDLLLMGFLLLEWERLREMKQAGVPAERGGEPWVQARTTDRLRSLESLCHEWNVEHIERSIRTERQRRRLLRELRRDRCQVA